MIPENIEEPSLRVVRDVGLAGSGSAANAAASSQTLTKGGGYGGGLSGANAGAGAQTFSGGLGGFGGGLSGASANAAAGTQSFGFGGQGGFGGAGGYGGGGRENINLFLTFFTIIKYLSRRSTSFHAAWIWIRIPRRCWIWSIWIM